MEPWSPGRQCASGEGGARGGARAAPGQLLACTPVWRGASLACTASRAQLTAGMLARSCLSLYGVVSSLTWGEITFEIPLFSTAITSATTWRRDMHFRRCAVFLRSRPPPPFRPRGTEKQIGEKGNFAAVFPVFPRSNSIRLTSAIAVRQPRACFANNYFAIKSAADSLTTRSLLDRKCKSGLAGARGVSERARRGASARGKKKTN